MIILKSQMKDDIISRESMSVQQKRSRNTEQRKEGNKSCLSPLSFPLYYLLL